MNNIELKDFPPSAKLFIGIFTTLMLCICLWVAFIYYVEEGMIEEGTLPLYLQDQNTEAIQLEDVAQEDFKEHLEHNVGLAHTHINGQTLLFFAIGLVFVFTSTIVKMKKATLWLFGISIVVHAIGLSGKGFHWLYNDILTLSGIAILVCILYMAYRIYIDLGKKSTN